MSNWSCVIDELFKNKQAPLTFGKETTHLFFHNPARLLHLLTYYKFASKMIGNQKRVLDIQCSEGLGTWILAKECGFCKGVDSSQRLLETAHKNFSDSSVQFCQESDFYGEPGEWDAIVNLETALIPNIEGSQVEKWTSSLSRTGICIYGIPHNADRSDRGEHIRMEEELQKYFHFTFCFSAMGTTIQPGLSRQASYYLVLGCKPRSNR